MDVVVLHSAHGHVKSHSKAHSIAAMLSHQISRGQSTNPFNSQSVGLDIGRKSSNIYWFIYWRFLAQKNHVHSSHKIENKSTATWFRLNKQMSWHCWPQGILFSDNNFSPKPFMVEFVYSNIVYFCFHFLWKYHSQSHALLLRWNEISM